MTEINKIIAHTIFSDILIDDIKVKQVRSPTELFPNIILIEVHEIFQPIDSNF